MGYCGYPEYKLYYKICDKAEPLIILQGNTTLE